MTYALLPNVESGGETFQPPLPIFFHHLATAVSACQPQRVQTSAQKSCLALSKPMAFFHLFLFPEKGGRGLVKTILLLTQV
jgi:hypothetical protein